jgi:uncharacterized Zn finger protein (UPF0148 family)
MNCRICGETIADSGLFFCPMCGMETAIIAEDASDNLKRFFGEREKRRRELFENLQKARAEIDKLKTAAEKAERDLKNVADETERRNRRTRLSLITESDWLMQLDEGEYSFGRLGPKTDRHFVIPDRKMEPRHFALSIEYETDSDPRCRIRRLGEGAVWIDTITGVGNDWTDVPLRTSITAGQTKMRILRNQ